MESQRGSNTVGSSKHGEREVSSHGSELSPGNGSATQSPSIQIMEEADAYRIPSSAFARNKSTTPMEWSTASYESLFSIHGTMSFTRDQCLLDEPGDLGSHGEPAAGDFDEKCSKSREGLGATEAAAGTKKEVPNGNTEENSKGRGFSLDGPPNGSRPSIHSNGSRSSVQSFAFPILNEEGKIGSPKVPMVEQQQGQGQGQEQQPENLSKPGTSEATPEAAQTSWFSCFPCCCPSRA